MAKISVLSGVLMGIGLSTACAEQKTMPGKRPALEKSSVTVETRKGAENANVPEVKVEEPVWTVANTPMALSCEPPANLGFKLSAGMSESNRYLLARFAMLGPAPLKFDKAFLTDFFKKAGFSELVTFEKTDKGVQGFVASSPQMNLVVFRGTHSAAGVMTDVKFFLAGSSFAGGVHSGFSAAYDSIKATINSALTGQRAKNPTFYVGHSLGGALAMLAATEGIQTGVNVGGLVTLGQPRSGNLSYAAGFSSALREKYFRYVHGNDPVPHLPPSPGGASQAANAVTSDNVLNLAVQTIAFARYAHVSTPIQLGQVAYAAEAYRSDDQWDSSYWKTNNSEVKGLFSSLTSSSANGSVSSLTQTGLIGEHAVEKYLCEMLKAVK